MFITFSGFAQQEIEVLSPEDQMFLEDSPLELKTSINNFTDGLRYVSHSEEKLEETYYMAHGKHSEINYRGMSLLRIS